MPRKSRLILTALWLAATLAVAQNHSPDLTPGLLAVSRQMVVVTSTNWGATTGWLRRFERNDRGWQITGVPFRVALGRGGLGWGRGVHPLPQVGPQKRDGDAKSPAGIFPLTYAFGYAAPDSVPEIKLPYIQCSAPVECVEDTNSAYYNVIVDRRSVGAPDWKSSKKMRANDDEHRLGIFIENNGSPALPGAGCCAFLDIWKGPDFPTTGSTAMSAGAMESLAGWLDAQAHPLLVQLPDAEYLRFQEAWQLPPLQFTNSPASAGANLQSN